MTLFYFDVSLGGRQHRDDQGQELPDVMSAKNEAVAIALALGSESITGPDTIEVDVRTAEDSKSFTVKLVVTVET